jgi:rare lipoprotein A
MFYCLGGPFGGASALARHSRCTLASIQMRIRALLPLLLLPLVFTGCAKRAKTWRTPPPPGKFVETGIASWYGNPYHGRATASGEIYDMEKFTAAHRTLPFNTWLRVENLSNHRSVEVKVNDRGPFARGRIIDLSRAAARWIELLGPGTAKVRLTSIRAPRREAQSPPEDLPVRPTRQPAPRARPSPFPVPVETPLPREIIAVQVGAFSERARAEDLRERLERRFGKARLIEKLGSPGVWRVLAGEYTGAAEAAAALNDLKKEFPGAFVVRLDAR